MKRSLIQCAARRAAAAVLIPLAGVSACASMQPPAHTTGPALSREGVQLAVNWQACVQTKEPDFYGNDLVEETLDVEVQNRTADPVTIHRDAFRLLEPDGVGLATVTWRAIDPVTVGAGQSRTFELRFMTRGNLECGREMGLEADAGVVLRDHPVHLQAIRFLPHGAS
jgi:hypothetical protein